jgi:hypothetical protein
VQTPTSLGLSRPPNGTTPLRAPLTPNRDAAFQRNPLLGNSSLQDDFVAQQRAGPDTIGSSSSENPPPIVNKKIAIL